MTKLKASFSGGYPHEGIKSLEVFPNRIQTDIQDERVTAEINTEHYPQWLEVKREPWETSDKEYIDKLVGFWMNRVHDYHRALNIAENQIRDMRSEFPFDPEEFGFKQEMINKTVIYRKNGWVITRGDGTTWGVQLGIGNTASYCTVDLPNSHIAFIVLRSMGAMSDDDVQTTEIEIGKERIPTTTKEDIKKYKASVERDAEFTRTHGIGLAFWSEEKNKYVIPNFPQYPERLWGREIMTEEFTWIRDTEEIAEIEAASK